VPVTSPRDAELHALGAARWRVALLLTGAMILLYFGFIALIAFAKPLMGHLLAPGLSVGIVLCSWLLTWFYVRWTNTHYDAQLERLRH